MIPADDAPSRPCARLGGDGIGPEVTAQALRVLRHVAARDGLPVTIEEGLFGMPAWRTHGSLLSPAMLEAEARADAVLFGATDSLDRAGVPAEERKRGGLLAMRRRLSLFANLRPVRTDPALAEVAPYKRGCWRAWTWSSCGSFRAASISASRAGWRRRPPARAAASTPMSTRRTRSSASPASPSPSRAPARAADQRGQGQCDGGWRAVAEHRDRLHSDEFRDVELDHMLADTCALMLSRDPARFDVILTDNLFGDVLSDAAAALTGSLGMLPSASLSAPGVDGRRRALYEPVHGAAPDIAGKGVANPLAAILSVAMLLRWTAGAEEAAQGVEAAVAAALADGVRTPDIALPGEPTVGTEAMGEAVLARLR
jgi:3-isopropylmalate dehydrogenase